MTDSLFLIDGHAQIYRAYYAPFGDLTSPDGEPTRATYVFCSMLFKLIQDRKPTFWGTALDSKDSTGSRRTVFAEYKANREATPEDLVPQIARIQQILEAMDMPVWTMAGYEADDILATLARTTTGLPVAVYLVSKDKDLEQVINDQVYLYDAMKDQVIDAHYLKTKKGYSPEQAIEIQSLVGDNIDNIPGISGVGVKTAAKLIDRFGTAERVIENAAELTPKMSEKVTAYAAQLPITRELVTLRQDLDVPFDLERARFRGLRKDRLRPLFESLGFTRLIEQLDKLPEHPDSQSAAVVASPSLPPSAPPGSLVETHLADDLDGLNRLARKAAAVDTIAIDGFSVGPNAADAVVVGLSICWEAGQAWYIPIQAAVGATVPIEAVLEAFRAVLTDPRIKKVGHDLKPLVVILERLGVRVEGVAFDAMLASFLLEPLRASHALATLGKELCDTRLPPVSDLTGRGRSQVGLEQLDTTQLGEYAAQRVELSWRLFTKLNVQLASTAMSTLFGDVEMPLVRVLADMEARGVALDRSVLGAIGEHLDERLSTLTDRVYELAGHPFNIDSTKQLAEVLFDELALPVVRKTKTGRSTAAETLAVLSEDTGHGLPQAVLEYRELIKLKNTYTDSLPRMVAVASGRVHASFNMIGAVTGRLSSNDPNLQNIPVRTETGRQIRRAFVAGAGWQLLSADYSQIELRLLAHYSEDDALLAAFRDDIDIHRFVASQVFGVPLDEVVSEQRSKAKAVNFGIIYGQTPFGLSRSTGMAVAEAKTFIDLYFMRYPGIRMFIDDCVAKAAVDGEVTTILGRRRPIPELSSRNRQKRQLGERLAINTVMQGSAADLIKRAMVDIHQRFHGDGDAPQLLIQVHDELVFEVRPDRLENDRRLIEEHMTTALPLRVPLKVDLSWGANWLESKA